MKNIFSLFILMLFAEQFCFAKNNDTLFCSLPTKVVADLILKNKFNPNTANHGIECAAACMDSLFSSNLKTRTFYFKVFDTIINKADGAIAEIVGFYLNDFVLKHPIEFAQNFDLKNKNEVALYFDYLPEVIYNKKKEKQIESYITWKSTILKQISDINSKSYKSF
jgi:hypothetical protein